MGKSTLENIEIVPLKLEHQEKLIEIRNKYICYLRQFKLNTSKNQLDWYNNINNDNRFILYGIELLENFIGACGFTYIDWVSKTAEISLIFDDYLNVDKANYVLNKIMVIGFNQYNFNKVWFEIYQNDTKKYNFLMDRLDFDLEATLKEWYFYDGKYVNSYFFTCNRKNFDAKLKDGYYK